MFFEKVKKHGLSGIFLLILSVCLASIMYINLSGHPIRYTTDMYTDMAYAVEVWNQKNIFPEGWVFGNQLYVVATPVVCALFYGLFRDPVLAMGMASTAMTLVALFSFNYMLKPVFPAFRQRLMSMAAFLTLVLAFGDAYLTLNGWQLLFTMCSYYSCYMITAFLGFGCYLRSTSEWSPKFIAVLCITCALSFATGIQSLRQTLVMVFPLIAAEMLKLFCLMVRKKRITDKSWLAAGLMAFSNFAGLLFAKILTVTQVEIFGHLGLVNISDALADFFPSLLNLFSLFGPANNLMMLIHSFIFLSVFFCILYKLLKENHHAAAVCLFLFGISVAFVLFVDIVSTILGREIYYFLVYPLIAIMIVFLHSYGGKVLYYLTTALLVLIFTFSCSEKLAPVILTPHSSAAYEEVADYLEEQEITTVFSAWNQSEKIAIASDWKIKAGFWASTDFPFVRVMHLCNPSVFDADPAKCAYVFFGEKDASIGEITARGRNADFTLLKHFEDSNIYVYTSTEMVMFSYG